MANTQEQPAENEQFPYHIGRDYEMWKRFEAVHGTEAYKWRERYERVSLMHGKLLNEALNQGNEPSDPGSSTS